MKLRFNPQPKPCAGKPGRRSGSSSRRDARRNRLKPRSGKRQLKSQPGFVRCMFTLTLAEYRIIQVCMRERGLPPGSYNAALQTILVEWKALKDQPHHPVLMAVPADMLPRATEGGEG